MIPKLKNLKIAIIGLGYVGLPLALEFAKKRFVIAFDVDKKRINELNSGLDRNKETDKFDLKKNKNLIFTNNEDYLKSANCYIVTVPTPIKNSKQPDLKLLMNASKMIGKFLKKRDLIVYESTVFPGCTEEICMPIIEKISNLKYNKDFFCGYSPERINPGDKMHTITNIKKITSGSTPEIARIVDNLYSEIITVGTFRAQSIKVAEAAKVIENTQRDLNIALINELSIIFSKMDIDTTSVLNAASTKWNFLPFKPGLVGGHCISVDPYYLTYKAKRIGYKPKVILAGREINDNMNRHVALEFVKKMKEKKIKLNGSKILIMGLTFKENCTDTRNSGTKDIFLQLKKFNCMVDLYDPLADKDAIKKIYNIYPISKLTKNNVYDGVIIVVPHKKFKNMGIKSIFKACKKNSVVFDLKNLFQSSQVDFKL
jgi:UDP-N-acetyl-D-galactosamine dehydrogenase